MSLFPIFEPAIVETIDALPLYQDVKWDYELDTPIFDGFGNPVLVSGLEAVKTWAWGALHTERQLHDIWSWQYGNDMWGLIGKAFSPELVTAETKRYISECLTSCPYITAVEDITVDFLGDCLSARCTIKTIYGEVTMHV